MMDVGPRRERADEDSPDTPPPTLHLLTETPKSPSKSVIGSALNIIKNYFTPERQPAPNNDVTSISIGITPLARQLASLSLNDSATTNNSIDSFKTSDSHLDESFQSVLSYPATDISDFDTSCQLNVALNSSDAFVLPEDSNRDVLHDGDQTFQNEDFTELDHTVSASFKQEEASVVNTVVSNSNDNVDIPHSDSIAVPENTCSVEEIENTDVSNSNDGVDIPQSDSTAAPENTYSVEKVLLSVLELPVITITASSPVKAVPADFVSFMNGHRSADSQSSDGDSSPECNLNDSIVEVPAIASFGRSCSSEASLVSEPEIEADQSIIYVETIPKSLNGAINTELTSATNIESFEEIPMSAATPCTFENDIETSVEGQNCINALFDDVSTFIDEVLQVAKNESAVQFQNTDVITLNSSGDEDIILVGNNTNHGPDMKPLHIHDISQETPVHGPQSIMQNPIESILSNETLILAARSLEKLSKFDYIESDTTQATPGEDLTVTVNEVSQCATAVGKEKMTLTTSLPAQDVTEINLSVLDHSIDVEKVVNRNSESVLKSPNSLPSISQISLDVPEKDFNVTITEASHDANAAAKGLNVSSNVLTHDISDKNSDEIGSSMAEPFSNAVINCSETVLKSVNLSNISHIDGDFSVLDNSHDIKVQNVNVLQKVILNLSNHVSETDLKALDTSLSTSQVESHAINEMLDASAHLSKEGCDALDMTMPVVDDAMIETVHAPSHLTSAQMPNRDLMNNSFNAHELSHYEVDPVNDKYISAETASKVANTGSYEFLIAVTDTPRADSLSLDNSLNVKHASQEIMGSNNLLNSEDPDANNVNNASVTREVEDEVKNAVSKEIFGSSSEKTLNESSHVPVSQDEFQANSLSDSLGTVAESASKLPNTLSYGILNVSHAPLSKTKTDLLDNSIISPDPMVKFVNNLSVPHSLILQNLPENGLSTMSEKDSSFMALTDLNSSIPPTITDTNASVLLESSITVAELAPATDNNSAKSALNDLRHNVSHLFASQTVDDKNKGTLLDTSITATEQALTRVMDLPKSDLKDPQDNDSTILQVVPNGNSCAPEDTLNALMNSNEVNVPSNCQILKDHQILAGSLPDFNDVLNNITASMNVVTDILNASGSKDKELCSLENPNNDATIVSPLLPRPDVEKDNRFKVSASTIEIISNENIISTLHQKIAKIDMCSSNSSESLIPEIISFSNVSTLFPSQKLYEVLDVTGDLSDKMIGETAAMYSDEETSRNLRNKEADTSITLSVSEVSANILQEITSQDSNASCSSVAEGNNDGAKDTTSALSAAEKTLQNSYEVNSVSCAEISISFEKVLSSDKESQRALCVTDLVSEKLKVNNESDPLVHNVKVVLGEEGISVGDFHYSENMSNVISEASASACAAKRLNTCVNLMDLSVDAIVSDSKAHLNTKIDTCLDARSPKITCEHSPASVDTVINYGESCLSPVGDEATMAFERALPDNLKERTLHQSPHHNVDRLIDVSPLIVGPVNESFNGRDIFSDTLSNNQYISGQLDLTDSEQQVTVGETESVEPSGRQLDFDSSVEEQDVSYGSQEQSMISDIMDTNEPMLSPILEVTELSAVSYASSPENAALAQCALPMDACKNTRSSLCVDETIENINDTAKKVQPDSITATSPLVESDAVCLYESTPLPSAVMRILNTHNDSDVSPIFSGTPENSHLRTAVNDSPISLLNLALIEVSKNSEIMITSPARNVSRHGENNSRKFETPAELNEVHFMERSSPHAATGIIVTAPKANEVPERSNMTSDVTLITKEVKVAPLLATQLIDNECIENQCELPSEKNRSNKNAYVGVLKEISNIIPETIVTKENKTTQHVVKPKANMSSEVVESGACALETIHEKYLSDTIAQSLSAPEGNASVEKSEENSGEVADSTGGLLKEIARLRDLYRQRDEEDNKRELEFQLKMEELYKKRSAADQVLQLSEERANQINYIEGNYRKVLYEFSLVSTEFQKTASEARAIITKNRVNSKNTNIEALEAEKEECTKHIESAESAFIDVLAKYEKLRTAARNWKVASTQEEMKIVEWRRNLSRMDENIRSTDASAKAELEELSCAIEEARDRFMAESLKISGQLRKAELVYNIKEESLAKIVAENEKLSALCDDIIDGKS